MRFSGHSVALPFVGLVSKEGKKEVNGRNILSLEVGYISSRMSSYPVLCFFHDQKGGLQFYELLVKVTLRQHA